MSKVKRALISVHEKSGVADFAGALSRMGIEILSTGGTAALLRSKGIPVVEVSDYTGSPEILDGRLKTLHPKVHGGLLGRRGDPKHVEQMKSNGIEPIDLLVVNLYPFEETVAKPNCAFADAIENIDIGGPAMIRAAAKNHDDVAVVVDPGDYGAILDELSANGGQLGAATRFRLTKKAFAVTARYDSSIATHLGSYDDKKEGRIDMPDTFGLVFQRVQGLRYGENPHQKAAFYKNSTFRGGPSIVSAVQLQGKELSYNNIMDADAVLGMVLDFLDAPFSAFITKHSNPCGAALSDRSVADAFAKAFSCDPLSAFGGIVGVNRAVDAEAAKAISETFFEVILAPDFDEGAMSILDKKKNLRLLRIPGLRDANRMRYSVRDVLGGCLIQERDSSREDVASGKVVTKRRPTDDEMRALGFAWRVCKHVKSNAIVFASSDRTIGIGAGQMSRVDSTKIAVMKAQSSLVGSVLASDAFFPFRDGIDVAAEAGATAVVEPGGSVRDAEVIAAADEHGIAMVFTGVRHFRH